MEAHRDNIERVLTAFEQGEWDEIHLVTGDIELHLVASTALDDAVHLLDKSRSSVPRTGGGTTPPAATPVANPPAGPPSRAVPAATTAETGSPTTVTATDAGALTEVTAPSPGIFWRSPSPGAPPFAEVGDQVGPDSTMCIVEIMKLMNHVTAQVPGTVVDVLVGNGEQVDRGQPLFRIRPEGA